VNAGVGQAWNRCARHEKHGQWDHLAIANGDSNRVPALRDKFAHVRCHHRIDSMEILDQACEAAATFRPLSKSQMQILLAKTAQAASQGQFELFKMTSIFDATTTNPKWLGEEPEWVQNLVPG
jgi:hypothetical protein